MRKFVGLLAITLALPMPALAQDRDGQIKKLFTEVNNTSKGALGPNTYQRGNGRTNVMQNGGIIGAPGGTAFTAAFRNAPAEKLAALDFYVGNRVSTNYWYLHNAYLATPQEQKALAFKQDQARFIATTQMAPQAWSMTRHMLMESFYMQKFPQTRLTRANLQRGTADAKSEEEFYGKYVQALAAWTQSDKDYLALYEFQRRINLTGDSAEVSLQKLRDNVAAIYTDIETYIGNEGATSEFRNIRNSIHNYMTPEVYGRINAYLKTYGDTVGSELSSRIEQLKNAIGLYYKSDKKTVMAAAKATKSLPAGTVEVINALSDKLNSPAQLETLSWMLPQVRDSFRTSKDPAAIHWMIKAQRYLSTQLSAQPMKAGEDWSIRARIALDAAYAAGLVTADLWTNARMSLSQPSLQDVEWVKARQADLVLVIQTAPVLVREALGPAINDWAKIESSTEGIVDDTLRSSQMTELNNIATMLKGKLPQASTKYTVENEGEAYGYLVYLPKGTTNETIARLEKNAIPVFAELPLDLGVVAGIITEQAQTPLSHVAIKSKARGTPNVYFPNASKEYATLLKKKALVKISTKGGKFEIREATLVEAQAAWNKKPAPTKVVVKSDLTEKRIRSSKELGHKDIITVGAKAANYSEMSKVLDDSIVREALGVPFFYYKEFLDTNMYDAQTTFAQRIEQIVKDPRTASDRNFRVTALEELQAKMIAEDAKVNPTLVAELKGKLDAMYPGSNIRFRSSTNSEDLPNFSGAGLYDSYSYDPSKKKKSIPNVLKRTWASVLNIRAFDERELFGIEHVNVYMAILVSPAYPDEMANGVAVTINKKAPELGAGSYINTQIGEDAVTNPDPSITPEELVLLNKPSNGLPYTFKYLKYSSLAGGKPVLTTEETVKLNQALWKMHAHFKKIVDPQDKNKNFAIDVEWKIDDINGQRQLFIKQARPYITN